MPYKRVAAMLVIVALLAATVTVLSSCSQPTPTEQAPVDEFAPTSDSPQDGDTDEGYPPPEDEEIEPPPEEGDEGYPPPPSATPTMHSYPEAEETPEADE